jgi:hypothetical protein
MLISFVPLFSVWQEPQKKKVFKKIKLFSLQMGRQISSSSHPLSPIHLTRSFHHFISKGLSSFLPSGVTQLLLRYEQLL